MYPSLQSNKIYLGEWVEVRGDWFRHYLTCLGIPPPKKNGWEDSLCYLLLLLVSEKKKTLKKKVVQQFEPKATQVYPRDILKRPSQAES